MASEALRLYEPSKLFENQALKWRMRLYYSEGAWLLTSCSLLIISGERISLSERRDNL